MFRLLIIILLIFFITYSLVRDLFHPAMIICESYLLGILCAYYNASSWGYKLEPLTVELISIGIISFIVGSMVAVNIPTIKLKRPKYSRGIKTEDIKIRLEPIEIDEIISYILLVINGGILVVYLMFWLKAIGGFNGITYLAAQMTDYRYALSYENNVENSIPGIINQCIKISKAIAYVYMYIYLNNRLIDKINHTKSKMDMKFVLNSLFYILITLMTGGRFEMFVYFIAYLTMGVVLEKTYLKQKTVPFKKIFKIVCFMVVMVVIFSISRTWVGRTDNSDILIHFTKYFGGGIKLLDEYIKNPVAKTDLWGAETFYAINKFRYQIGLVEEMHSRHLEFRAVNGIMIGNVYTAIRSIYQDFNLVGLIMLQFLFGLFMTRFYKNIKYNRNGRISIKIIMYCIIVHTVYLSSYAENFYNTIVSLNYVVFLICLIIIVRIIEKIHIKRYI